MAYQEPNKDGFYGKFGGRFVPETLMTAVLELEKAYRESQADPSFQEELNQLLRQYVGRETPLYYAKNLTQHIGGAKIYLKREDLNHTGAHKINNALGQVLLAKRMGKKKIIAETGAGQHGVATATAAALFNMECTIYMGEEDVKRQALNVFRMELLGAKVEAVTDGSRVLKDAVNAALRSWVANIDDTHYILGSALGPHPFPEIVRDFQSVIGREAKQQYRDLTGQDLPDALVACVGGGSNAIGLFHPFVEDESVAMYGAEAAGLGVDTEHHAATLTKGRPGVLHGSLMDVLQDAHGQILEAFSISAGLDYPGIGPEHSHYHVVGTRMWFKSKTAWKQMQQRREKLMPKTLTEKLNAIKAAGKGIFVPYIMAGDHDKGLDGLAETIHFLEDLGVSAIEVGIPFSDPVADGPVIEEAGLRSLAHGTSTQALVETLKTIETEVPLVIMTYFNPLFQYGVENFVKDLADTAVKGLIIPDLPHEHANFVEPFLADTDIALIPLVSLTTGIERQKELIDGAEGFVYAVAINGVTGKSGNYRADLDKHLAQLHQVADIPVLTGFGVSSQADVERFNAVSDGVIVGSKIVKALHEGESIEDFIKQAVAYQK